MDNVIQKVQQLNAVFQKSVTSMIPLKDLCSQLCNIIESNIYLFYARGEIFSYSIASTFRCPYNDTALDSTDLPGYYLDLFYDSNCAQFNIYEEAPLCTCEGVEKCLYQNRYYSMVPIFSNIAKSAGMLLIRYGKPFEKDEEVLCQYTAAIISIELVRQEQARIQQEAMELARAQMAVHSLSFSERKASAAVFALLDNGAGTVFLNAVSDQIYTTSSVVSGALKKLESAGLIETKSQGVKGKFVCIKNDYLVRELEAADQAPKPSC